jgi:hypothetical protein
VFFCSVCSIVARRWAHVDGGLYLLTCKHIVGVLLVHRTQYYLIIRDQESMMSVIRLAGLTLNNFTFGFVTCLQQCFLAGLFWRLALRPDVAHQVGALIDVGRCSSLWARARLTISSPFPVICLFHGPCRKIPETLTLQTSFLSPRRPVPWSPIDLARGPLARVHLLAYRANLITPTLLPTTTLTTHVSERLFSHLGFRLRNNYRYCAAYTLPKIVSTKASLIWRLPMRGQRRQAAPTEASLRRCHRA